MENILTFWLLPAEPARTFFCGLIAELAARFDAPVFEPHVTVYVIDAQKDDAMKFLNCASANTGSPRLSITGIECSDVFTKTLFVQFEPDGDLARLSEDLRRVSASRNDYQLNPHLSLLYKDLDTETKRQLADSIRLPFDEIVFDSVKAVISPAEIRSRAEVEAWRVVAERRLAT
jgi:2'-5' RNA ligase